MKLQQLSLFLENRPGQLIEPCRLLSRAGVNIRTLSLADTERFGILRLIVSDPRKAQDVLQNSGYVVNMTDVVAVEVADRPGGLEDVIEVFDENHINIEYMYAFTFGREDRAVLIFRVDAPDEAIDCLQRAGINVVGSVEVYNRIAK